MAGIIFQIHEESLFTNGSESSGADRTAKQDLGVPKHVPVGSGNLCGN
jgi:hypothetical protein